MTDAARDGIPGRVDPDATLVVTRPEDDARALVDALRARGRDVVLLPVLAIRPADDEAALVRAMADVPDYRLVVFVSPNAIRHGLARRPAPWPERTAIGVMGPGSVEALAVHGLLAPAYRIVAPAGADRAGGDGDFDSEALYRALEAAIGIGPGFGGRVLLVRGQGGRGWLADRLRSMNIAVDEVEAYRRVRPRASAEAASRLRGLFDAGRSPVFVVTSSEGVGHLQTIVEEAVAGDRPDDSAAVREWLLDATILAPHRRIAETARAMLFRHIVMCAPGNRGIVAAIE